MFSHQLITYKKIFPLSFQLYERSNYIEVTLPAQTLTVGRAGCEAHRTHIGCTTCPYSVDVGFICKHHSHNKVRILNQLSITILRYSEWESKWSSKVFRLMNNFNWSECIYFNILLTEKPLMSCSIVAFLGEQIMTVARS